jgi:hypothetical protein
MARRPKAARVTLLRLPRALQGAFSDLGEPQDTHVWVQWLNRVWPEAGDSLRELVRLGCDPRLLALCLMEIQVQQHLSVYSREELLKVNVTLGKAIDVLEGLLNANVRFQLGFENIQDVYGRLSDLWVTIKRTAPGLSRKSNPAVNTFIGMLMLYVKGKTGTYQDPHIAALVSAATGQDDFNTQLWRRTWRRYLKTAPGDVVRTLETRREDSYPPVLGS